MLKLAFFPRISLERKVGDNVGQVRGEQAPSVGQVSVPSTEEVIDVGVDVVKSTLGAVMNVAYGVSCSVLGGLNLICDTTLVSVSYISNVCHGKNLSLKKYMYGTKFSHLFGGTSTMLTHNNIKHKSFL